MRFEVAHGQLDEHELEQRMMRFLRGEADVLVATSIIESGIDIPQANTLIIERADMLRPRPALPDPRARRPQPRARLRLPPLPERCGADRGGDEAPQRAVATTPSSGAGFKIAMRDLEIRGAGNLLGDEQSGHVAALGFELYLSMLDEAVRAAGPAPKAGDEAEPVRLDVNVDAYVPADYIPYEAAKIDVHRRIAGAREVADLARAARRARGSLRPGSRAAREPPRRCSRRGSSSGRPGRAR